MQRSIMSDVCGFRLFVPLAFLQTHLPCPPCVLGAAESLHLYYLSPAPFLAPLSREMLQLPQTCLEDVGSHLPNCWSVMQFSGIFVACPFSSTRERSSSCMPLYWRVMSCVSSKVHFCSSSSSFRMSSTRTPSSRFAEIALAASSVRSATVRCEVKHFSLSKKQDVYLVGAVKTGMWVDRTALLPHHLSHLLLPCLFPLL